MRWARSPTNVVCMAVPAIDKKFYGVPGESDVEEFDEDIVYRIQTTKQYTVERRYEMAVGINETFKMREGDLMFFDEGSADTLLPTMGHFLFRPRNPNA